MQVFLELDGKSRILVSQLNIIIIKASVLITASSFCSWLRRQWFGEKNPGVMYFKCCANVLLTVRQPLDDFCEVTRREIMVVCGNKLPSPEEWIFSSKNRPLLPDCSLNALELSNKSPDAIHEIISTGTSGMMKEEYQKARNASGAAAAGDRNSKGDETLTALLTENP